MTTFDKGKLFDFKDLALVKTTVIASLFKQRMFSAERCQFRQICLFQQIIPDQNYQFQHKHFLDLKDNLCLNCE